MDGLLVSVEGRPASAGPETGDRLGALPVLAIRDVVKTFAATGKNGTAHTALAGIDLDVASGEFVSVIGPSGCGKSTLLDIVAGLLPPSSGEVLVQGQKVVGPGADRAVVFQNYALFPWRSVTDNIGFPLEVRGVDKATRRDRARRALELVGLTKFADHYPAQLSGGMRQRVAIARAFVGDPTILLMDEPFGALDAFTRELLQGQLSALHRQQGKTVMFVTHSVSEAVRLSDRVVVLGTNPGRVVGTFDLSSSVSVDEDHLADRERDLSDVRDEIWELLVEHGIGKQGAED